MSFIDVTTITLETVLKSWVTWVFTGVLGAVVFLVKRYFKLEKKNLEDKQKERMGELRKEVKDEIVKEIADEIDRVEQEGSRLQEKLEGLEEEDCMLHGELKEVASTLNVVTCGVLSIQGKDFKAECRRLLAEGHKITTEEFEELEDEYEVYTNLGGNGKGTALFEAVKAKYMAQLSK